jgi:hypothetical protein
MYQLTDVQGEFSLLIKKWSTYAAASAELATIETALGTDPTTRDLTISLPPAAVKPDHKLHTPFTNQALLIVNKAKGGNIHPTAIATALQNAIAGSAVPVNLTAPVASGAATVGSVLTVTNGTWSNFPSSYTYQWRRGAANIAGATAATYTLVAADSTTTVTCRVTAHNGAGASAFAASNGISVTLLG